MKLVIPILHHPQIHGEANEPFNGHYICYTILTNEKFYKNEYNDVLSLIKQRIETKDIVNYDHPIRNYVNVMKKTNIEIVELVRLKTGEDICIIKTHLIKQIQRKWREIYKNKVALSKTI